MRAEALPQTTLRERIAAGGDGATAAYAKQVETWAARFPNSTAIGEARQAMQRPLTIARTAFGAGSVTDVADKLLGNSISVPSKTALLQYNHAKDHFTAQIGSPW